MEKFVWKLACGRCHKNITLKRTLLSYVSAHELGQDEQFKVVLTDRRIYDSEVVDRRGYGALFTVSHTCIASESMLVDAGYNDCHQTSHSAYETFDRNNSTRKKHVNGKTCNCDREADGHPRCISDGVEMAPSSNTGPLAVALSANRRHRRLDELLLRSP